MPTYSIYARVVPMSDRTGTVIIGTETSGEQIEAEDEALALEIAFTQIFGAHTRVVENPSKLGMQTSDAKRVVYIRNAERNRHMAAETDQQFCDVYIRQQASN